MVHAQFQMPDPKQMAGIPRPVTDLPNGTVSVRLIRGALSNNIINFPVELSVGGKIRTAKTDESGRAEFKDLPAGESLKAIAVVDGERLESEEFPAPAQGGIRLMLVATDKSKGPAVEPNAPAIPGQVVLGNQSRIIVQPGDENVALYYLLEILNNARVPVNVSPNFAFDMPSGAVGTSVLEGSSPQASVNGPRVTVQGPFAPGRTLVQVACELAVGSASLQLTQRFPASLEQLSVIVKKTGDIRITSPQLASQQDMTASGETFIAAAGRGVGAGQPIVLTLDNLPHHSAVPRWIALSLVTAIIIGGVWMSRRPDDAEAKAAERKRLFARREKLFAELIRLENDQRNGKVGQNRYASRREEIIAALEHVYGALDSDNLGPDPANHPGVAA
ncbi:MAG: hypothetical protein C5B57_09525 [Blastocatellia bacterium]|nr:MAG: hypothetical protein C5B57_09525 [Blastocatellia bacterium]